MPDKPTAKREFLSVDVGEISLVDEPANESPIAVMKRKEQDDMSTPAQAQSNMPAQSPGESTAPVAKAESPESIEMEADDATSEVLKALQDIGDRITEAVTKAQSPSDEDDDVEKAGKGDKKMPPFMAKAEEEKQKKAAALRKQLESAGLSKADIDKAVKAAFGDSGLGLGNDKGAKVSKGLDEDVAFDALDQLQEAIAKAKKFTPKRVKELQDAVSKLNALLGEVTTEHPDKAAFGPSGVPPQGTVPTSAPPMMDTTGAGQPGTPANTITKSVGDADAVAEAVAKALAPLADVITGLKERVESIEKARVPSTAQPEGETETNEPVNKSKSIWSGVL